MPFDLTLRAILAPSRLASAGAFVLVVAACSSRPGFDPPPQGFNPDAGKLCSDRKCSRDLHSIVLECDGKEDVIETCPEDKGCGGGTCVAPCESARLSKGSVGCSFWTLPPDDAIYGNGSCFAAMVANTWTRPITLRGALGGETVDISKSTYTAAKSGEDTTYTLLTGPVPAGEVAIVFISGLDAPPTGVDPLNFTKCPDGVTPAVKIDPFLKGTAKSRAFHVETDAPVSAYSIFPYGGAATQYPAATLLLPVTSWDKNYVAVSTAAVTLTGAPGNEPRILQIVADEDDTKVEMRPTVGIGSGQDVAPVLQGETQSWTLSRGQVLQISQHGDTTGSPIVASKPVGVFGGSSCAYLPGENTACDMTHQQIAPFAQWGHEYALVPYAPRIRSVSGEERELVPWGLVGAVGGTVLTYDPERPRGAPETLGAGEVATFFTDRQVVVKSQDADHPFHASVYMTGGAFFGGIETPSGGSRPSTLGDPEFVTVVPSDQFLDRYVFFTDYTYPETTLTIVRRKTSRGFLPVELACAGEVTTFKPLGSSGEYEFAWVRLTEGFVPQPFAKGTCGYGRQEAKSEGPFSVTVWGLGYWASYGYAGGTGSRSVNNAVPPPIR